MKSLWIIRHAKSSWADTGQADFDRGLNKRGQRDGERLQAHLPSLAAAPTWLWVSGAVRAQATAAYVRRGFAVADEHCITLEDLYHASAETVLDVFRQTPDDVPSVGVIAHNPGLTDLVNRLGPQPVTDNLPTFGIAQFEFSGTHYADLGFGRAKLKLLLTPKSLRG